MASVIGKVPLYSTDFNFSQKEPFWGWYGPHVHDFQEKVLLHTRVYCNFSITPKSLSKPPHDNDNMIFQKVYSSAQIFGTKNWA